MATLKKIAAPSDCGCRPCHGSCRSETALEAALDEIRDLACVALAATTGAQCCRPTADEEVLLATGEYTPEELWGGPRPTCPKCLKSGA